MTPPIEEIARGLTEAQRQALVRGNWNVVGISKGLIEVGIVERIAQYCVGLTPLGLALRTHLQSRQP